MPSEKVIDKVIVTNVEAMKAKYGASYAAVREAVQQLISSDAARGIVTVLVDISSPTEMSKHRGAAVASDARTDCKGNKAAIDAVCKPLEPEYVLLLGRRT